LGDNWQEIRDKYVHTLGNLTLTAQNSKLSNKDFQSKQEIDLHTSKLKLSYKLADEAIWNNETILARSQKLASEAIQIWQYPQTEYTAEITEKEIYTLDEDLDFKGQKPKTLYFGDKTFEIKYWRDILKIVCDELYQYSPTEFNSIIQNSELTKYFATNETKENLRVLQAFGNNKFVDGDQSANSIISFTKKLCDILKFDASSIQIEV